MPCLFSKYMTNPDQCSQLLKSQPHFSNTIHIMSAFIITNDKKKITMLIQGINAKLLWLRSIYTSPALTVMMWGVKLAPTEHATHSPKGTNYHSISNQDM